LIEGIPEDFFVVDNCV